MLDVTKSDAVDGRSAEENTIASRIRNAVNGSKVSEEEKAAILEEAEQLGKELTMGPSTTSVV
jgi:hypothetical protein